MVTTKSEEICTCGHIFIMHVSEKTLAEVDCQLCSCSQFKKKESP